MPTRRRNPPRAGSLPTPFERDTCVFQENRKLRRDRVETVLEAVLDTNVKLPRRFFDGQRTPIESLSAYLNMSHVECSPNDAHRSLNFITAALAMATGIHNKNDLSATTRPLFEHDHEIHKAEANQMLQQINAQFPELANTPIGTISYDPNAPEQADERIPYLLNLIEASHNTKLNICLLGVEAHRSSRGKQAAYLVTQNEFRHEGASAEGNAYMVYDEENGRFMPLRTREMLTNPRLSPGLRFAKKSVSQKISCAASDIRHAVSFSARVKAYALSDPELYEKAVDKATGKPKVMGNDSNENEYIKEWLKRTDPDYKLKKQARLSDSKFQKFKSALPFTLNRLTENPYLDFKTPALSDMLNDVASRPSRKERKFIKKAIYRNYVMAAEPAALNPLPPAPVAFAGPDQFRNIMGNFNALLQPGGDPSRSPFADNKYYGVREMLTAAQVSVTEGFKTGNSHDISVAHGKCQRVLRKLTSSADRNGVAQDAGPADLLFKMKVLEQSLAQLKENQALPPHQRMAEIADVLRKCGFLEEHVTRFTNAVEPVMAQRRDAVASLQRFLVSDAKLQGHSGEAIEAMPELDLISQTKTVINERQLALNKVLEQIEKTNQEIADHENYMATQADPNNRFNVPAEPGSFLNRMFASMAFGGASGSTIESQLAALRTGLVQTQSKVVELEIFALENRDAEEHAETQARQLEDSAAVWAAINAIWRECDALKTRTASLENHSTLLEASSRTLRGPMNEVFRYMDA